MEGGEEREGASRVKDAAAELEPPMRLSVGKGSLEASSLPGEGVSSGVSEGSPLAVGGSERVGAREGDTAAE
jgi:hypothetical protein